MVQTFGGIGIALLAVCARATQQQPGSWADSIAQQGLDAASQNTSMTLEDFMKGLTLTNLHLSQDDQNRIRQGMAGVNIPGMPGASVDAAISTSTGDTMAAVLAAAASTTMTPASNDSTTPCSVDSGMSDQSNHSNSTQHSNDDDDDDHHDDGDDGSLPDSSEHSNASHQSNVSHDSSDSSMSDNSSLTDLPQNGNDRDFTHDSENSSIVSHRSSDSSMSDNSSLTDLPHNGNNSDFTHDSGNSSIVVDTVDNGNQSSSGNDTDLSKLWSVSQQAASRDEIQSQAPLLAGLALLGVVSAMAIGIRISDSCRATRDLHLLRQDSEGDLELGNYYGGE